MGKKQDSLIGIIIVCLIVIGMMAKFVEENPNLSLLILLLAVCSVVAYFNSKSKQKEQPTSIRFHYDEDDREDEDDDECYQNYSPPPVFQYWDDIDYAVPVNSNLNIEYTNAAGEISRRDISISHYDGSCYLRGFCHLRGEPRTFRIDRVSSCIDRDTGEVVSDIPAHLRQKYESSAEYIVEELYSNEKDIIRSLFFVGKADGQLRKPERKIIYSVCRQLLKDKEISDEALDRMINNIDLPSMHAFKRAIGRLAKESPEKLLMVSEYSNKIVNTQKTIHPVEQEALDYIKKKSQQVGALDRQSAALLGGK